MPEYLEAVVDKFIFRVAVDRWYTAEGVWAKMEGQQVRIGVSDYLQQRSGDVAFITVKPVGTEIALAAELAEIETIKVNISLASPVHGKVIGVNPAMESAPEVINQDPYGAGWLAELDPADWEADLSRLLDAQAYFTKMSLEAAEEAKKS